MQNPNEIDFKMVAVTKVEANGVEYAPGEKFTVTGIGTVRWLQQRGAAEIESSAEAAPVEDGGQSPQPTLASPAIEGTQDENPTPTEGNRRRR